ncbi:hypothetical protein AAVH_09494 [Aphelenchoides avenae]|nr:hypothetical protein AAVH_09494 [Aphelenchus avenae]
MQDGTTERVQVPRGTYATPEAFARALNDALSALKVQVDYDPDAMRYAMRFNTPEIKYIAMSNQMYYVLGYSRAQKPVVVGDCMSQLLRIVSVTGKHGDNVERIFDSPLYCNVSARDVSKILIDIRTLDNHPVLFSTGNVICTLLFRKVSLI